MHNVHVQKLLQTAQEFREDPDKAKRPASLQGVWNVQEGEPQFTAVVKFEGGESVLEMDQPTFLGGGGTRPGPIQYCLYGFAACFAGTLASVAAEQGVTLKRLEVTVETTLDFSRVFGLSENPIAEGITIVPLIEADADPSTIQRVKELAAQRCPAVYCLTNPIRVSVT
ncbi:MAG: OsmC family protein [Armatimonadota bacterium]|nr:OsmC family protein [Armatimonadota bacterium]